MTSFGVSEIVTSLGTLKVLAIEILRHPLHNKKDILRHPIACSTYRTKIGTVRKETIYGGARRAQSYFLRRYVDPIGTDKQRHQESRAWVLPWSSASCCLEKHKLCIV